MLNNLVRVKIDTRGCCSYAICIFPQHVLAALVSMGAYFEFFLISNNDYIDDDHIAARIDVHASGGDN